MDAGNVVTGGHPIIGLRIIDDPVQGLLLRHFDPAYGKVFDKPLPEYTSHSVQQGKQFTPVVEVIHPENSVERAFIRVEGGIQADADAISMWALSDTTDTIRLMEQAGQLWGTLLGGAQSLGRISFADLPAGQLAYAAITGLDAFGLPSEGRIVLDWSTYDVVAQKDLLLYRIYRSAQHFTVVTGATLIATVYARRASWRRRSRTCRSSSKTSASA